MLDDSDRPDQPTDATEEGTGVPADPLSVLASYLDSDGTLRVPGLAITDASGRDLMALRVHDGRAELAVRLPSPPTELPTTVAIFADDGPAQTPDVEPSVGIAVSVKGNDAVLLEVIPDLRSGWRIVASTPEPPGRD